MFRLTMLSIMFTIFKTWCTFIKKNSSETNKYAELTHFLKYRTKRSLKTKTHVGECDVRTLSFSQTRYRTVQYCQLAQFPISLQARHFSSLTVWSKLSCSLLFCWSIADLHKVPWFIMWTTNDFSLMLGINFPSSVFHKWLLICIW